MNIKLAVVGNRYIDADNFIIYNNYKYVSLKILDAIKCLKIFNAEFNVTEITSGGAVGIDFLAKKFACENNLIFKEFSANWKKYGKSAGFRRNGEIVNYCNQLIAFWDGKSKGTKHSIDLAKKYGKLLCVYELE